MKLVPIFISVVLCLFIGSTANAQITNMLVNGSSTSFTMGSGDAIGWTCDVPAGSTITGIFWYDVNQNGTVEPGVDFPYFTFTQTDGDITGNGGPPDMDGLVNGHLLFSQNVGIAPGKYILTFSQNASSVTVFGTVTPLASPAHSIAGHVTVPAGKSPKGILMDLNANQGDKFWDAITDSLGNYTIQMNSDTAGNPWRIRINYNPFPGSIVLPSDTMLTIVGNPSGYNFTILAAAAQVTGKIVEENGQPRLNAGAYIRRNDTTNFFRDARVDGNGFFDIGLLAGEVGSQGWILEMESNGPYQMTTTELTPHVEFQTISVGDSIFKTLKVYQVNSVIKGRVYINHVPINFPLTIMAMAPDTALATAMVDSATGRFSIPVSDKLSAYSINFQFLPGNWNYNPVVAHANDTTVVINISMETFTNTNYHPSWNILSVPLDVPDYHKSTLFQFAQSPAYFYVNPTGYRVDSILTRGAGYWLKYPDFNNVQFFGFPFYTDTIGVQTGWNMIGCVSDSVKTNTIVPLGTTITSPYWMYGQTGYQSVTTLGPGTGYWVKTTGPGQIVLNSVASGPVAVRSHTAVSPAGQTGVSTIRLSDASGQTRAVYFTESRRDFGADAYQMPPLPPPGVFDARFATQNQLEVATGTATRNVPLVLSSAVYPVVVSWTASDAKGSAALVVDGVVMPMRHDGQAIIKNEHSTVELRFTGVTPETYALYHNYPNPFNPSTTISYDIADRTNVKLTVYSILGEEVATLVNDVQDAGRYAVPFAPSTLASGIYYYKLTAGSFTQVGKMMLLK